VSHKHHSIIRIGTGLIQFVYGSHSKRGHGAHLIKKSIFAIFRASFFGVLRVEELQDLKTKFVRVGLNEVGLALAISYNKNAIGLAVDYSSRTLLLCVRIRLHIGIAHPLSATAVRPRSAAEILLCEGQIVCQAIHNICDI